MYSVLVLLSLKLLDSKVCLQDSSLFETFARMHHILLCFSALISKINALMYGVVLSYQSWVVYKESSWITATLWAVLLVCLGRYSTFILVFKTTLLVSTILLFSLLFLYVIRRPCSHCPSQWPINIMHKCLSVWNYIFRDADNLFIIPFTALLHVATLYCNSWSFHLRNL